MVQGRFHKGKMKQKKFNKVKVVKEMSRERLSIPRPQVVPDKRYKYWESLAKSVASRHGEEI